MEVKKVAEEWEIWDEEEEAAMLWNALDTNIFLVSIFLDFIFLFF